MKKIINFVLSVLKVILLLVSAGLIFYGLLVTYARVDRSIGHAIPVLIPFVLLLILSAISFIYKIKLVNNNLFFNVTTVISLFAITYIGYRAKFETNATLYYKYKIGYNPSYLSDNIGTVQTLVYLLVIVNALLIAYAMFFNKTGKQVNAVLEKTEEVKDEIADAVDENSQPIETPLVEEQPVIEPVVESMSVVEKNTITPVEEPKEEVLSESAVKEEVPTNTVVTEIAEPQVYSIPTENRTINN